MPWDSLLPDPVSSPSSPTTLRPSRAPSKSTSPPSPTGPTPPPSTTTSCPPQKRNGSWCTCPRKVRCPRRDVFYQLTVDSLPEDHAHETAAINLRRPPRRRCGGRDRLLRIQLRTGHPVRPRRRQGRGDPRQPRQGRGPLIGL